MSDCRPTIQVLVCTFRRPHLRKTLESLSAQILPPDVSIGVIVADNDDLPSAKDMIEEVHRTFPHPLRYIHAPARNISVARNACLEAAQSPWVAFLDDDEVASPQWIGSLWETVRRTGADAAFGPVLANYPVDTPQWILRLDAHSTQPVERSGRVETGYTGNVLLRWRDAPWIDQRFEKARGVTGGEDTAFFFALSRMGAQYVSAPEARVEEVVTPGRLTFGWLARRRFRMGQTYVSSTSTPSARLVLLLTALGKSLLCGAAAIVSLPWSERRVFWALRGLLHLGVVAGCLTQLFSTTSRMAF